LTITAHEQLRQRVMVRGFFSPRCSFNQELSSFLLFASVSEHPLGCGTPWPLLYPPSRILRTISENLGTKTLLLSAAP
jgi:hypothetical protein